MLIVLKWRNTILKGLQNENAGMKAIRNEPSIFITPPVPRS